MDIKTKFGWRKEANKSEHKKEPHTTAGMAVEGVCHYGLPPDAKERKM